VYTSIIVVLVGVFYNERADDMNKLKIFTTVFLTGLVVFSTSVQSADGTATLVASRGEVHAVTADTNRALSQGDSVFVEDQIITGDKSFAILQFIDGAKVTVRPNSQLAIEKYVFNGGDQDAATLNLMKGGLRIITGAMAKVQPESYKVKTPVALMGVRGTEFAVMLCDDQICEEEDAPIEGLDDVEGSGN
jgi:hypothetical protein